MTCSRATITPEGQESQTPPATAPDDAVLVAAAQVDPTAFAPLYAPYLPPVYRYCYRRLGTSAAAEDATSEIFVKVLAALPRYRAGSFRSWLFTIAHHVIMDIRVKPGPIACTQPFDFRFTVPFVPGGAVDLHRSVMTDGTGVTFERVVLTPIETTVYVQWITRERAMRNVPLIVQLTVNGHALDNGTDQSYPNGLTLNVFKPIADERGKATLVASVPRSYLPKGHPQLGPWTTRFTLPSGKVPALDKES